MRYEAYLLNLVVELPKQTRSSLGGAGVSSPQQQLRKVVQQRPKSRQQWPLHQYAQVMRDSSDYHCNA